MSYASDIIQACPAIQQALNDAWIDGTFPGADVEPMPLLEYLASPANRTGIVTNIIKGTGQLGVAEVTYLKRFLLNQGRTDATVPDCSGGEKFGNEKATYTFDTTKNVATPKQLVGLMDYVNACPSPVELLTPQVMRHMELLDRLVAQSVATAVVAGAGSWAASVPGVVADVLTLRSLKTDGESIDPRAHIKIMNALQDSGAPGATPLFGGTTGREYYQASQIGCCSNEGLGIADALSAFGKAYGYDFYLQGIMGADEWLAVAPQAVQLLNWNKAVLNANMGDQWLSSADYVMVPLTSPRTGLTYDFTFANNCGQMTAFGAAYVQPIFLPDDKFQHGDNLFGTNGVYKGEFANCEAPECAD
jgi:hypothetical protein